MRSSGRWLGGSATAVCWQLGREEHTEDAWIPCDSCFVCSNFLSFPRLPSALYALTLPRWAFIGTFGRGWLMCSNASEVSPPRSGTRFVTGTYFTGGQLQWQTLQGPVRGCRNPTCAAAGVRLLPRGACNLNRR